MNAMIDGVALAALADRLAEAADQLEKARTDYRAGLAALDDASAGQAVSAGLRSAAGALDPTDGFALVGQQLRSLAAATDQFAAAARSSSADLATADDAARHELAWARIRDGGIDGAHTLVAAALAAADRDAIQQDLAEAGERAAQQHAEPSTALGGAALPVRALTAATAAVATHHRINSATTDHSPTRDAGAYLQSRMLDFAPHLPVHLPGWRVAVGLCRHPNGPDVTVIATPEPAPYLRPGFVLIDGEKLVGTGIEPELAILNYAQAQDLSLIAVATGSAPDDILDMLTERDVDVLDPFGVTDA